MDVTFCESQSYFPKSDIQGKSSKEYQIWDVLQDSHAVIIPSNQPLNSNPAIVLAITPIRTVTVLSLGIEPKVTTKAQNPLQLDTHNTELCVYRKRRIVEQTEEPLQTQHSQSPEPNPTVSNNQNGIDSCPPYLHAPMIDDSDLPIALRKGVHGCTEHPIERYVAYGKLSPSYKAFVMNMDGVKVPEFYLGGSYEARVEESCRRRGSGLRKQHHLGLYTVATKKNLVGCKWIFNVKYKAHGSIDRFKVRLMEKGFTQSYKIDYQ